MISITLANLISQYHCVLSQLLFVKCEDALIKTVVYKTGSKLVHKRPITQARQYLTQCSYLQSIQKLFKFSSKESTFYQLMLLMHMRLTKLLLHLCLNQDVSLCLSALISIGKRIQETLSIDMRKGGRSLIVLCFTPSFPIV